MAFFLATDEVAAGSDRAYTGDAIKEATHLPEAEINDAVDELSQQGLVKTLMFFGTAPYDFGQVEPTYALFHKLKDQLPYNPEHDVIATVAAIVSLGQGDGPALAKETGLPIHRLNRAMQYIQDYGLAQVMNFLGTAPFDFGRVQATRHTRDYAESHAA